MPAATDLPRDTLLTLCAGGGAALDPAALAPLGPQQWDWIGQRARQYRVLPLLHAAFARRPDWPVPDSLRETCLADYRSWVFRSLIMQQALIEIGELMDRNAIAYCGLKGASLSLEFYPEPALRPMRDLDIMVPPHAAERAYELLKSAGFRKISGEVDYGTEFCHHLPALVNANGVVLELHHRIAPREWSGSQPLAQRLLTRARCVDFQGHTIRMAHPTDTLLHLVVHAAFQHLFDNGPHLLSDIEGLANSGLVEWDEVAAFAGEHALGASLQLSLALHARYRGGSASAPRGPVETPPDLIDQAASLMTQDPDQHWQRFLLRKRRNVLQRFLEGISRAFTPTRRDLAKIAKKDVHGMAALLYYPAWLLTRARVYLGAEFQAGLDQQAAADARLESWLGRPALVEEESGR